MKRLMAKPTKWHVCPAKTQIAWASTHSDQSLRCPHEESLGPRLPIERTVKTLIRLGAHSILLVLSRGSSDIAGNIEQDTTPNLRITNIYLCQLYISSKGILLNQSKSYRSIKSITVEKISKVS